MSKREDLLSLLKVFGEDAKDINRFATDVLGLRVNPAQRRWFDRISRLDDLERWYFRRVIHQAANQIGKTLGLAVADLWAAHNKIGIPAGDPQHRLGVPYIVIHLGPDLGTARKMLNSDMIPLLEGRHPAQFDKDTNKFRPCHFPREAWKQVNFEGEYPGIQLWNNAEIHFRTLAERAQGISQITANVISVDEAALDPDLKETENVTLRMRVVATHGPIWFIGTPDGPNDFAEMIWDIQATGQQTEDRVWEDEENKRALVWSIFQDNVGYGVTQEEADYQEATLDPAIKEAKLRGAILFPSKAFFAPAANMLKTWVPGLRSRETPNPGHKYVIFWDVSVESDPTVMIVLDVTRKPWRGVKFRRWVKPMPVQTLVQAMKDEHYAWQQGQPGMTRPTVVTGFDATSMGGTVIGQLLGDLSPKRGMDLAGSAKKKLQALTDLRGAMSSLQLLWPEDWLTLRKEIMGYRLDDKHIRQDAVMAAAGAVWVALRGDIKMKPTRFETGWREGLVSVG